MEPEEVLKRYFEAWLRVDPQILCQTFAENATYSECYGPEYHDLPQILRWFTEWNQRGQVLQWSIKRMIRQGRTLVAEWYFQCEYDQQTDGFDGVTLADFDDSGRIVKLCEFQSKAAHYFPYGP